MSTPSRGPQVRRRMTFGLLSPAVTTAEGVGSAALVGLAVVLSWWAHDPDAVHLRFTHPDRRWVLGRALLAEGLDGPAGLGDVSVLPDLGDPDRVELVLSTPDGRVGFVVDRAELAGFLAATWAVVPAGQEERWLWFDPAQFVTDDGGGSEVAA